MNAHFCKRCNLLGAVVEAFDYNAVDLNRCKAGFYSFVDTFDYFRKQVKSGNTPVTVSLGRINANINSL